MTEIEDKEDNVIVGNGKSRHELPRYSPCSQLCVEREKEYVVLRKGDKGSDTGRG